jgi:uncharacterized protein (DUF697 family)
MSTAATVESTTTEAPVVEKEVPCAKSMSMDERKAYVADLIKKHALGAAGVGLIPMPALDFVALTGVQVNLLRKLSDFYGVSFTEEIGKKVIGALAGGYAPVALALPVASLLKAIPVIGQTTGILAMSAVGGASTYAVGKVFVQHFESGGTFLNFDPAAVREYYREQFKEGSEVVKTAS